MKFDKKKMLSKMKDAKLPPKGGKGDADGADPVFHIDDTEDGAGEGDVDNMSKNDSPDSDSDGRMIARAKDGSESKGGPSEEGSPDEEATEGPAEKKEESDHLKDVTDEDLLEELKRRGHPAGERLEASEGVDKSADDEDDVEDYK
jgi:hypothetical protein